MTRVPVPHLLSLLVKVRLHHGTRKRSGFSYASPYLKHEVDAVCAKKETRKIMRANMVFDAKIGEGAYGVVWRAKKIDSDELVAIKCIDIPEGKPDIAQIVRELRALRVFDHAHVLRLREVYEDSGGQLAIVTDVADCTLHSLISVLAKSERLHLLEQSLLGIAYLHARGWIHCDIKPDNIFIFGNTAVIGDLGMIRHVHDSSEVPSYIVTRWYRPPEVAFENDAFTTAIDIWSLACVWFQMLCNGKPMMTPNQGELPTYFGAMFGLPSEIQCYRTLCAKAQGGVAAEWLKRKHHAHRVRSTVNIEVDDYVPELQAIHKMLDFDDRKRPTARQVLCEHFCRDTEEPSLSADPVDAADAFNGVDALRGEITRCVHSSAI